MNAQPVIYCSSCLLGKRCLYHGYRATFARDFISRLELRGFKIIDACPEMLGGLTCPRPAAHSLGSRLYHGKTDVTQNFDLGARKALALVGESQPPPVLCLLLKNSPSCDPSFGVFGKQVIRLAPVVACKRDVDWEAEAEAVLSHFAFPQ